MSYGGQSIQRNSPPVESCNLTEADFEHMRDKGLGCEDVRSLLDAQESAGWPGVMNEPMPASFATKYPDIANQFATNGQFYDVEIRPGKQLEDAIYEDPFMTIIFDHTRRRVIEGRQVPNDPRGVEVHKIRRSALAFILIQCGD